MISVIAFLTTSISAWAAPDYCGSVRNFQEFYQCTLEKHPRMAIAREKTNEADAVYERAAQWKNPDLNVKTVGGKIAGENNGSTEVTVLVPASQLWIRGAQKDMAEAEKRVIEVEAKQTILEFKKEIIGDLIRARQIDESLDVVNETLDAFKTIQGQLNARRARGPDQEITLNLVQLASSDYQLKRNHLVVEKGGILSKFRAIWGHGFELKKEFLPPIRTKWPEVKLASGVGQNLAVQKAVATAEQAAAGYRLTKLETMPAISVGPTMERTTSGPSRSWSFGFTVAASLPIFSFNGGSRAVAKSQAMQAELDSAYAVKKFDFEREILLQRYRSAVESLSVSSSRAELRNKHNRVDSYFRQGLASGGLVIEAHRQIVEYQNSQHEHEDTAVDAYIDLMVLTGGDVEGIIR